MTKLYFPELSYRIVGVLFETYNALGYGYQEKYYQRTVQKLLEKEKIIYLKELSCPLKVNNQIIGQYQLDFLIDNKIVLELKVAENFYPRHIKQVLGYLKLHNLKLGILAIFTKEGLKYKRILN